MESTPVHPALRDIVEHTYDQRQGKLTLRDTDTLPDAIFDMAEDIRILDISHTRITTLPDDCSRLSQLQIFFASHCDFREVPRVLGACPALMTIGMQASHVQEVPAESLPPRLQALILTDNDVTSLPSSIGVYQELRKLALAGNRLRDLPQELLQCPVLEFMRLAVNELDKEPTWLFEHPALAWYGDASNRYSPVHATAADMEIRWQDLDVGELLSSNRKNQVFTATVRASGEPVAVKLYGMDISPDGATEDEIRANIALDLPNLRRVTGAPGDRPALMMPLLDASYTSPGQPPTLWTVTRDTYTADQRYTASYALQVLKDVAEQMALMHSKHVMHGDLYAHNILSSRHGESKVTDFGAASPYAASSGHLREHVEVNAFGHLADELVGRSDEKLDILAELRAACHDPVVADRPSFSEISSALSVLPP